MGCDPKNLSLESWHYWQFLFSGSGIVVTTSHVDFVQPLLKDADYFLSRRLRPGKVARVSH